MNTIDIKSILINEKNINFLTDNDTNSWNIKRLLGVNISQSQSIRFGTIFQDFVKSIIKAKVVR